MSLRRVSLAVVALLALQGCTKTVYYAVVTPQEAMVDQNGCFRQCQIAHSAQTKQFVSCVENCPSTRVVNEKKCEEISFDSQTYGCTTMHAQALDKGALGLGIVLLILLNIIAVVIVASHSNNSQP